MTGFVTPNAGQTTGAPLISRMTLNVRSPSAPVVITLCGDVCGRTPHPTTASAKSATTVACRACPKRGSTSTPILYQHDRSNLATMLFWLQRMRKGADFSGARQGPLSPARWASIDRMRYRAVVFDLWGTLVPFRPAEWRPTLSSMAEVLGLSDELFYEAWSAAYGERIIGSLDASIRSVGAALGVPLRQEDVDAAIQLRIAAHGKQFVPRRDAVETLAALRRSGRKVGLITNCSSEVPRLWADSPLAGRADALVFSCAEGLKKPNPAIYRLACERLATPPGACLYVGDGADHELEGAEAVGMTAVLLDDGGIQPPQPVPWSGLRVPSLAAVVPLALRPNGDRARHGLDHRPGYGRGSGRKPSSTRKEERQDNPD